MASTSVEGIGYLGKAHLGVAEVSGSSVPQNPSPSVVVGCSAPLDSAPVARAEVQRLASKGPQGLGVPRGRSRGRSSSKRTQPRGQEPGSLGNQPARSWANVVRAATKGYDLTFIPPTFVDNKAVVNLPEKVLEVADPKWSQCLVGHFVGKKFSFKFTEAALTQAWGPKLAGVMANGQGFYFLHIPDADFRRKILEGGLITVARVPLVLQQWKPLMDLKKDNHSTVPVWIRLKNLPCDLWSPPAISAIASTVGKPLYVDQWTEQMNMISFARVCVEISANLSPCSSVEVVLNGISRTVAIEFEWRPVSCQKCGIFGHSCPAPTTDPPASEAAAAAQVQGSAAQEAPAAPPNDVPAPQDHGPSPVSEAAGAPGCPDAGWKLFQIGDRPATPEVAPLPAPAAAVLPLGSEPGWKQVKGKKNKPPVVKDLALSIPVPPSEDGQILILKDAVSGKVMPSTSTRKAYKSLRNSSKSDDGCSIPVVDRANPASTPVAPATSGEDLGNSLSLLSSSDDEDLMENAQENPCSVCHKRFRSTAALFGHMKIHSRKDDERHNQCADHGKGSRSMKSCRDCARPIHDKERLNLSLSSEDHYVGLSKTKGHLLLSVLFDDEAKHMTRRKRTPLVSCNVDERTEGVLFPVPNGFSLSSEADQDPANEAAVEYNERHSRGYTRMKQEGVKLEVPAGMLGGAWEVEHKKPEAARADEQPLHEVAMMDRDMMQIAGSDSRAKAEPWIEPGLNSHRDNVCAEDSPVFSELGEQKKYKSKDTESYKQDAPIDASWGIEGNRGCAEPERLKNYSEKVKRHICSICRKDFSSGQALGGHKRAHYVKNPETNAEMLTTAATQQRLGDITNMVDL